MRLGVGSAIAVIAVLTALICATPASAQCAMCGSAAGAGDLGFGLNVSILFLLGILAAAVAGLVILIVRASRQAARRAPAAGE